MAATLTKDETRVLSAQAQVVLAEEAEAEAARLAGEESQRRELVRLAKAVAEDRKVAGAYFDAVAESERLFGEWLKAEAEIYRTAKAWRKFSGFRASDRIRDTVIAKRNSGYISLGLKTLSGATSGRYGDLTLSQYFGRSGVWLEAERQALGEKET